MKNSMLFTFSRTRLCALRVASQCSLRTAFFGASFLLASLSASAAESANVTVDFATSPGKVRPELHSANIRTPSYRRKWSDEDGYIREMNLQAFRTHDCPLECDGQMIVDTHCIFPLMHLDPKDPKNYIFRPTDYFLDINFATGMKCFYRLGSSIEHTGDWGYNTLNPADHDQYAEVLAGIVRHYTRGWANGYYWKDRIIGWELFNEPDIASCWRGTPEDFRHLYITCLRRLKSEFPELKIGGPAFGWLNPPFMNQILDDCRVNGVKPDFIAWHAYYNDVDRVLAQPAQMRAMCEQHGFPDMELILDEWHYLPNNRFRGIQKGTPEEMIAAHEGPGGIKHIDAAVFALQVETGFHDTPLSQSYYYGCYFQNDWGYADEFRRPAKVFYHLKLTGELVRDCLDRVTCTSDTKSVRAFGAWSKDRTGVKLVVSDYVGSNTVVNVTVAGAGNLKPASVRILDNARDLADWTGYTWKDGALELRKDGPGSCAFAVDFK